MAKRLCPDFRFSLRNLSDLRVSAVNFIENVYRRYAENAEVTQRIPIKDTTGGTADLTARHDT